MYWGIGIFGFGCGKAATAMAEDTPHSEETIIFFLDNLFMYNLLIGSILSSKKNKVKYFLIISIIFIIFTILCALKARKIGKRLNTEADKLTKNYAKNKNAWIKIGLAGNKFFIFPSYSVLFGRNSMVNLILP
jgi:hypothetical protein